MPIEQIIDSRLALHEVITSFILSKEHELEHELSTEYKRFLLNTLTQVVIHAVHKFIKGAKEHDADGDFLREIDHVNELFNEQIDSIMYVSALRMIMHKYDERYK